jgi:ABC-type sugar transport system permease subunit
MNPPSKLYKAFRFTILLTLIALVLEFILGTYTNLFVEFPDSIVDGNGWAWSMSQSPIIIAHVLLGSLLLAAALLALGLGIALKSKTAIGSSAAGLVMMGLAYLSGGAFLTNIQMDGYSFLMALGFMGSLAAYCAAYYLTRPASQVAS